MNNHAEEYWSVGRAEGDLLITSTEAEPVIWNLLEIHKSNRKSREEQIPFCSNDNANHIDPKLVHTKGEIQRFVKGLGLESYLELTNITYQACELENDKLKNLKYETDDETMEYKKKEKLFLEFQNKIPDHYLRYDMLAYIKSRVQWELKEYECLGIFR